MIISEKSMIVYLASLGVKVQNLRKTGKSDLTLGKENAIILIDEIENAVDNIPKKILTKESHK